MSSRKRYKSSRPATLSAWLLTTIFIGSLLIQPRQSAAEDIKPALRASGEPTCELVGEAMGFAVKIRGLKKLKDVPCHLRQRSEVEEYLRNAIQTKIPKLKLESEAAIYRAFGIIPPDYDYVNGIIQLYTEQIGGYYDPEKEYYAMAAWMPNMMQLPIAVHELTHALQDQHFNLDHLVSDQMQDSDRMLAQSALVEGDATAVMIDFTRGMVGQPGLQFEESVGPIMAQNIIGMGLTAAMGSGPKPLYALMVFPYISGLNFAHSQLKIDGYKSVDKAFRKMPESTEEILHPEKYRKPKEYEILEPLQPSALFPVKSGPPAHKDRMGEFFLSVMLSSWVGPSKSSVAASGWGGDRVAVFHSKVTGQSVVTLVTRWDSENDAVEFASTLVEAWSKRGGKQAASELAPASDVFTLPGGMRSSIRRTGDRVMMEVGPG